MSTNLPFLSCARSYTNTPAVELTNAAVEQQKITELRLRKTFGGEEAAAQSAPAAADADRRAGRLLAQLAPRAGLLLHGVAWPAPPAW